MHASTAETLTAGYNNLLLMYLFYMCFADDVHEVMPGQTKQHE